jgi:spermidine synthase
VRIFYQDARRFLTQTKNRYDVIILGLPEPTNAQLNRYYSREFFHTAAQHLKSGGVFSFSLGSGGISLNPLRAAYLALNFNTLLQVFPEVLVFPGERVRLFASPSPGTLTADPQVLMARLTARRLEVHYVREYYLLVDLALPRLQYLASILHQQPVEINTDLNPRGYFYDLVLTGVREGLPLKDVLLALKRLPWFTPWIALGLAFFLFWLLTRGRPGLRYLTHVLVMGWGTMSLEVLMLVLYQIHLGYLYRQIGIVIAAFMLGLSAGGLLWVRLPLSPQSKSQWLVTLQLGLAALSLLLSGVLLLSQSTAWLPPDWLVQSGFVLVLALAGFAGGGIFSLSSDLWRLLRPASPTEGGLFYAVDLLGATLGTLGTSLLILPVWGILPTLGSVAALHALAALCLVGR